jgi:NDP-sugar pyrophosphorylase family protein
MQGAALPPLFDELPETFRVDYDRDAPWLLLDEPLASAVDGQTPDQIDIALPPDVHLLGSGFAIGKGTRIGAGAVLEGPLWIGRDVTIRPGAYLRGGVWVGDDCLIGAATEVKHAIFMPGARAPHLNYVGDSVLGRDVNLGAGTILSNFRHDGRLVRIPGAGTAGETTGRRKLGAVLGDGVKTGCNCVLHPGTVVGARTEVYPGVQLRAGVYPADSIVKLRQQIEIVERSRS